MCRFAAAVGLLAATSLVVTLVQMPRCDIPVEHAAQSQQPETKSGKPDWPLFGGTPSRNMVNLTDKNIATDFSVEEGKEKNIKWKVSLGNRCYGGPVIAGGRVFVGTNNPKVGNEKKDYKSILMCFRETDGKQLWQVSHEAAQGDIFEHVADMGLLSTPVVDGDRVFYVLPQSVVVCLDVKEGKPLWQYDMAKELKVVPYHCSNCSPLVAGDLLYLITGNGVDEQTDKVRDKDVPAFIAINKSTGKLVWQNNLPGDRVIEGQWSNPAYAVINGKPQVIFPGGDAVLYSFEPETGKLIWQCSCLPKNAKPKGNAGTPYIIATPVIHDNKVFIALGVYPGGHPKLPRHSHFLCIDATRTGDVSPGTSYDPKAADNKNSAILWSYGGPVEPAPKGQVRPVHFGSSISTCAVHDGLVYIAEEGSYVHCLDAATGKRYWMEDLKNSVWGSTYYVDGKVYLGTEDGELVIFQAGKQLKIINRVDMNETLHGTPVVVNGVLFVATKSKLYAIVEK